MSDEPKTVNAEPERDHALLSASSAKIWLACTPSAREAEQYEDKGSSYADEGTAAHTYAELRIRNTLLADSYNFAEVQEFRDSNPYYNGEMEEAITEYVNYIVERFNAAKARTSDAILYVEQRLDYSEYAPEGFGTGDVIIIADDTLEVIDLKYGKGVPVSAIRNPQLSLYGVAAWSAYSLLYDIVTVIMTICQPRLDSTSTYAVPAATLEEWATNYVSPRAALAWQGAGEFNPGEHCRFCNALPHCRALAEYNLSLAAYDFVEGNELKLEDLADIIDRGELLKLWIEKITAYALDQAVNHGALIPGWKLVEGRSNRKYIDQDKVAAALIAAGYDEAIIYERSLLGITAMESAIGKKKFSELLADFIQKPPGAPTLAKEDDKRAAIGSTQSAINDFKE